jgi:hypothetical protein
MQNFTMISNPLKKFKKNAPKKFLAKQVLSKTRSMNMSKSEKVNISVTFLLLTYLGEFFKNFFNGFKINVKFCVF